MYKKSRELGIMRKIRNIICTLSCDSGHYSFAAFVRRIVDKRDRDIPP